MGNVLTTAQDFYWTIKRRTSQRMSEAEVRKENLLSELVKMSQVELWRLHWCLIQGLHQDLPPIPPQWLLPADAIKTANTMIQCYQAEGALIVLDAALIKLGQTNLVHPSLKLLSPPLTPKLGHVPLHRRQLISKMQCWDDLLRELQNRNVLNAADKESINVYGLSKDKKRALVDLVLSKGNKTQEVFSEVLSQSQPFLLQEVESSLIKVKVCSLTY